MRYIRVARGIAFIAFLSIALLSAGCRFYNHHTHNDSVVTESEEALHDAVAVVHSNGAEVEVEKEGSPILGVKVIVPENAVDSGDEVKVYIDSEEVLPGALDSNASRASRVIVLTKDSGYKFLLPVTVTMPYDDSQMDSDDIPLVLYWDEESGKYVAVGVKDIDTVNKLITFTTIHFSKFVVVGVKGLGSALADAGSVFWTTSGLTGFMPDTDGFFHPNFGSYDSPGGSGIGMAGFAQWYYVFMKDEDGNGLFDKHREGDPARWEDDTTIRELISRAYVSSSRIWSQLWTQSTYKLDKEKTGKLFISAMKVTKAPQTMLLTGQNFAHAVTVYGYEHGTPNGTFYVCDSNFPGEVVTLKWNRTDGFFDYSKAAAYPAIEQYGFDAYSTIFSLKEFGALYQGAQSGWDASKFQNIAITAPALDANGTAVVSDPDNITITGTVSGGSKAARYLVYNVNGADGLGGRLVTLGSNGSFSFTIPNLPRSTNSIMMITTDDERDARRRVPSAYAGFREILIKVQGQNFFTNLGFETGDFTAWAYETHVWPGEYDYGQDLYWIQSILGVSDPDDLTDPHFPSIQKVYKGDYSAQLNDTNGMYHITTFTQSATVPTNVANPELRFYWAAILEQPYHTMEPYIDIVVTDDTSGQTLFTQYFSTSDTSYSGWIWDGGYWYAIPWQTVIVPCAAVKGHQITLKVTAADCGWGGHGGYVYLDGEE